MPNMSGRPGHRTMEMNGVSSPPCLACTPCVPLFLLCLIGVETERLLDYQGRAGIISIVRWNVRPKRKRKKIAFFFVSVACCCGLCKPNMLIAKANAKENLGEFAFPLRKQRKQQKLPRFHRPLNGPF